MHTKPNPSSAPRLQSGFTLTELLVVILIIVVLAGMLFPLVTNMRNAATRSQCMNQFRNWGVAFSGYAADHDGKINWEHWPSIGTDPLQYSPYIPYWTGDSDDRTGFQMQLAQRNCPAVKYKTGNSPVTYSTIQPVGISKVGISGRINGESSDYPLSKITRPNRFMLMIETLAPTGKVGYSVSAAADFTSRVKPITDPGPDLRHNRRINALMGDYSVREMYWKDVEKGLSYWTTF